MSQKIMQMFVLCLAVVLFAPLATVNFEAGESHRLNETTHENDALHRIDAAELPQSKNLHRHSIKRAVHRFNLGLKRFSTRFRAAVQRITDGLSSVYDEEGMRRVQPKTEAQCASCDEVESIDSPFVIRIAGQRIKPQCPDCALDLQLSNHFETDAEMPRSQAFSAVILGIFFAVCAVFIDPSMASSVAFIGATRMQLPDSLKQMQKHGFKVRRVAKNRDTACYECLEPLTHNGEYGMPYVGMAVKNFKSKKPHCKSCAVLRFTGQKDEQKSDDLPESIPTPEPEQIPTPPESKNALQEAIDKALSRTEPEPQPAQNLDETGSQLAHLISQMTASGVDESKVRAIAQSVFNVENKGLQATIMQKVTKELEAMTKPTVIQLKKGNSEPVPMSGIQHYMLPEILSDIVHCEAKNLNLTGEAGTGKTHLIDAINSALQGLGWFESKGMTENREAFILSANKDMQAPELIGRESPIFFKTEGYEAGEWAFIKGAILPNFEHGGIIGLDEMDRFADSTLSALNAALANGFITTPKGERILRHPAAIVIATGNTKGQGRSQKYSAANAQDGATLDRFAMRFIDIDYDPAIEEAICGDSELVEAIRAVRKLSNQHEIKGAIFSYRCMAEASKDLKAGRSLAFIMRRMVMAYGEEAAVKLGHGKPVAFDFKAMWGEGELFTTENTTSGGA
tara:strand:+ start:995 stop:3040 length:2046 start_codon:yes stop_codon:yes gene_type:complete